MFMRTPMRFLFVASITMLTLFAGSMSGSAQATTIKDRMVEPFEFDGINPCTGETVVVSGELLITNKATFDAAGGGHFTFTLVPRQVRGEGESGTVYKAVGGQREHFNVNAGESLTDTFTNAFNLISQGGGDNFIVHITFHTTVNANGDVTSEMLLDRAECVG